jgi:hypothetical protein
VNIQAENDEDVPTSDEDEQDDNISGRYVRTNTPLWGRRGSFASMLAVDLDTFCFSIQLSATRGNIML